MVFKIGNKIWLGRHHSEESKKKMSEVHKGHLYSEESKRKMSKSQKGKIFSEDTRKKLSEWQKGEPKSDEHKKKISEAKKGIFPSEVTRRKLSEAQKGNKNSLGFHHSEDTRKKMSKSHNGKCHSEEAKRKISEAKKRDIKNIEMLRNMTIKKPTKPQLKLFEIIKTRFPDKEVVMEQIIKTPSGHKFIDVAIPDLKLGFEWDEPTYHGMFRGSKEKDAERHRLIEAEGWQLTHYSNISEFKKIGSPSLC